jgi:hypothetical protein
VYDEADGDIDFAALQYKYVQASLAAELAIQLTGSHSVQASTEQHVMATPEVMVSQPKKRRTLRKAFSTMKKACKAAIAALSCF